MIDYLDFNGMLMKPLLFNLIHQTILPFNEETRTISAGDKVGISFDNIPFKNYFLLITNVSFTNFNKLSNRDMFENGFMYKPIFTSFIKESKNVENNNSIVKIEFQLMEMEENL